MAPPQHISLQGCGKKKETDPEQPYSRRELKRRPGLVTEWVRYLELAQAAAAQLAARPGPPPPPDAALH
eukprot:1195195-Prorocentrum_minimum.AAC.3